MLGLVLSVVLFGLTGLLPPGAGSLGASNLTGGERGMEQDLRAAFSGRWQIITIADMALAVGVNPWIEVTSETIRSSAGCNIFVMPYELAPDGKMRVSAPQPWGRGKICAQDIMDLELDLSRLIGRADELRIEPSGKMTLFGRGRELILAERRE